MVVGTPVEDLVALVTDPKHPRFGQSAAVSSHKWSERPGTVFVQFADKSRIGFHDGAERGDAPSRITQFYRRPNDTGAAWDEERRLGPRAYLRAARTAGRTCEDVKEEYAAIFGEEFSTTYMQ